MPTNDNSNKAAVKKRKNTRNNGDLDNKNRETNVEPLSPAIQKPGIIIVCVIFCYLNN